MRGQSCDGTGLNLADGCKHEYDARKDVTTQHKADPIQARLSVLTGAQGWCENINSS